MLPCCHAAADMFSRFCKIACGVSPSSMAVMTTDNIHDDEEGNPRSSGLISPLLHSPDRTSRCMSHPSVVKFSPETDNDDAVALPCLAFASEDGYMAFSLGEGRMREDIAIRLAHGRRYVPSPYGGKLFATDMCGRHPCHLVDPFTGKVTPLPDLPVPFSEETPMPVAGDELQHPRFRLSTDDGFAWDWSPRGVMVARGDTTFFCETGGGEWKPVHRSRHGSRMTINYRAGFFFVLEVRSRRAAVIDAETLDCFAEIARPPGRLEDITWASLVVSTDDVLLLVRRRSASGYRYGDAKGTFSQAYRAPYRERRPDRPIEWEPVTDIGDRAVFVDNAHGFTVRAGNGAMRNFVYRARYVKLEQEDQEEKPSGRDETVPMIVVSPLSDLGKMEVVEGSEVLKRCKVQPTWGEGYWVMYNHGSSPSW